MARKARAECFVQIAGRHIRRRISFAVNAVIKSETGKLFARLADMKIRLATNSVRLAGRSYNFVRIGELLYEG